MDTMDHSNTQTVIINSGNASSEKLHKPIYGKSGLKNTGNTCYMNSAIQAFSHLNPLTHYFFMSEDEIINIIKNNASRIFKNDPAFSINSSNPFYKFGVSDFVPLELKQKIHNEQFDPASITKEETELLLNRSMTYQLLRLLKALWKVNGTYQPTSFRKIFSSVRQKFFYGPDQHDAEEAYSCILQQMQEELGQNQQIEFKTGPSVDYFVKTKNNIIKRIETATHKEEKYNIYKEYLQLKKNMPNEYIIVESFRQMKPYYSSSGCKITELFTGFLQSIATCSRCNFASNKFDAFLSLPIQLSNPQPVIDIKTCMDEYFAECHLDDDNLYNCEKCKTQVKISKKMQIWSLPQILVIQLVRFRVIENPRWRTGMNIDSKYVSTKVDKLIEFPLDNLDLGKYISPINSNPTKCSTYKLQCVINHAGNVYAGHYFTYARDEETNRWFKYNDDLVTEISPKMITSKQAYLLFYIRDDMFKSPNN